MTTKTDSFPTILNPLSGHWTTAAGGCKSTASGIVKATGSSPQDNVSIWSTSDYTFPADYTVGINFSNATNFDWPGFVARCTGTGTSMTGYAVYAIPESGSVVVYKLATSGTIGSGSTNAIGGATSLTLTGSHAMTLTLTGTSLVLKLDTTTLATITDSSYASGQPGVAYEFGGSNASQINSFTATDATSGGPSIAVLTANYYRRRRLM